MITNEDRHLTTRLLMGGWKVSFVSDVHIATETPTTLRRYLLQQTRWARAIHIETTHQPVVYLQQPPILLFQALKRQPSAVLAPATLVLYIFTGRTFFRAVSMADLLRRLMFRVVYLALRQPWRLSWQSWLYVIPAQAFYTLTLPAINLWALLTVFYDGWGTTARAKAEDRQQVKWKTKIWEMDYFVVWMAALGAGTGRMVAMEIGYSNDGAGFCAVAGGLTIGAVFCVWLYHSD